MEIVCTTSILEGKKFICYRSTINFFNIKLFSKFFFVCFNSTCVAIPTFVSLYYLMFEVPYYNILRN